MRRDVRWGLWLGLALSASPAALWPAPGETYGPGPEAFTPVGRFVFRNEAEALGRNVAETHGLESPIHVVEVTLERPGGAEAAPAWNVVVVGRVPDGCHVVTVGLSADTGKVRTVADRRVSMEKPLADCERWYFEGAQEAKGPPIARTTTARTGPPAPAGSPAAAPAPSAVPAQNRRKGQPPASLEREEVVQLATELAEDAGLKEIEPKLSELKDGTWRQDVIGRTKRGCAVYMLELRSPDWAMRYQLRKAPGRSIGDCREWYVREGRVPVEKDWDKGRIRW